MHSPFKTPLKQVGAPGKEVFERSIFANADAFIRLVDWNSTQIQRSKDEYGQRRRLSDRDRQPRRSAGSCRQTLGSSDAAVAGALQHRQGSDASRDDNGVRDAE